MDNADNNNENDDCGGNYARRRTFLRSFAPSKSESADYARPMMSPLQRTLLTEERHPLERPNTYYSAAALRRHDNRTPPSRKRLAPLFFLPSFARSRANSLCIRRSIVVGDKTA